LNIELTDKLYDDTGSNKQSCDTTGNDLGAKLETMIYGENPNKIIINSNPNNRNNNSNNSNNSNNNVQSSVTDVELQNWFNQFNGNTDINKLANKLTHNMVVVIKKYNRAHIIIKYFITNMGNMTPDLKDKLLLEVKGEYNLLDTNLAKLNLNISNNNINNLSIDEVNKNETGIIEIKLIMQYLLQIKNEISKKKGGTNKKPNKTTRKKRYNRNKLNKFTNNTRRQMKR
jgi:hypothetical protein